MFELNFSSCFYSFDDGIGIMPIKQRVPTETWIQLDKKEFFNYIYLILFIYPHQHWSCSSTVPCMMWCNICSIRTVITVLKNLNKLLVLQIVHYNVRHLWSHCTHQKHKLRTNSLSMQSLKYKTKLTGTVFKLVSGLHLLQLQLLPVTGFHPGPLPNAKTTQFISSKRL